MRRLVIGVGCFGMLCTAASAFPITYTETGVGSGTFAGTAFTDKEIMLTFVGDTTNIDDFSPIYNNTGGVTTVTIADIGSGTISDAFVYANNANSPASVGIGDYASGTTIIGTLDNQFSNYALDILDAYTSTSVISSDVSFTTSAGALQITSLGESTFSAISAVPLPASVNLFGAALLVVGVASFGRRVAASTKTSPGRSA